MPSSASSNTVRRSSRSPSGSSNGSLSPEATAYQLLASQLEKEEWRQLSDRKGGFALVKRGHTIDDAVDGESMLKQEGFTLQKYQDLFFATMEQEELEEWTDKLPDHPKLPKKTVSVSPSDESSLEGEEEERELIGGGSAPSKKRTKKSTNKKSQKKRKKSSSKNDNDLDSDGEDGIPGGELRRLQKQVFDTFFAAKAQFDTFSPSPSAPPDSLEDMKALVKTTMQVILRNEHGCDRMSKFKEDKGHPMVRMAKAAIRAYVQEQADALERDMLEEFVCDEWVLPEEKEESGAVSEDGGEVVETDKVDDEGEDDKLEKNGPSQGVLSEGEVEEAEQVEAAGNANADWTSAQIMGAAVESS